VIKEQGIPCQTRQILRYALIGKSPLFCVLYELNILPWLLFRPGFLCFLQTEDQIRLSTGFQQAHSWGRRWLPSASRTLRSVVWYFTDVSDALAASLLPWWWTTSETSVNLYQTARCNFSATVLQLASMRTWNLPCKWQYWNFTALNWRCYQRT
jgi:hypothetical protein